MPRSSRARPLCQDIARRTVGLGWAAALSAVLAASGCQSLDSSLVGATPAPNGGSAAQYPQTLAKAAAAIKNVDTVIPGHRQLATWKEFEEYGAFMKDVVDFARSSMKANKTVAQAASEFKVPAKYSGYVVTIDKELVNPETIFQIVYDDLKK